MKKIIQNNQNIKIYLILFIFAACLLSRLTLTQANTSALSSPTSISSSSNDCGNPALNSDSDILTQPISGSLYVRLPLSGNPINVSLYSQNIQTNACTLLGTASAQYGHWTYIANPGIESIGTVLVVQGQNLGAEPYTASAALLALPNNSACQPSQTCTTSYGGYQGNLQPNLISTNTDQIAIYVANPINNVEYASVNNYADGTFLYTTKKILPLNRNYLGGGTHSTLVQVNFVNGEKFNIYQTINMGPDLTGTLFIRSTLYRSHNKILFFAVIALAVLILCLLLWLVRVIYRRIKSRKAHGLDKIRDLPKLDIPDEKDKIVVG